MGTLRMGIFGIQFTHPNLMGFPANLNVGVASSQEDINLRVSGVLV